MVFWNSLAGRLFKLVFGAYLVLAVFVTIVQLVIEYSTVQRTIANDLDSLGKSFNGSVTGAMWEMDRTLLDTMARGIAQSSIVTGVKITSAGGETFAMAGDIPTKSYSDGSIRILSPFLFTETRLVKQTPMGERDLGVLTIFSDRSVAIDKITYSFMVILINSIVKTLGLWVIFYLVISWGLSRPLSKLTEVVSRIKFASESNIPISLDYPYQDELGTLSESMIKMQQRLFHARSELEMVNVHLEEIVAERTQRLSEALNFSETILLSSPLPMGVYSEKGKCVLANKAYAALMNSTVDELLNRDLEDFTALNMTEVRNQCRAALITHKSRQLEITIQNSTGKLLWFECRILPTITNGQYHVLVQFIDLTERRRIEEDLRYHAFHDALTRLPNRRLLLDRLKQSVYSSKRQNSHGAVLLLDMNRFKQLNDTYGHDAGDLMLIEVADRLQRVVRVTDTVARLGGDEFVVLLEGLGPDKEIAKTHAVSITDKIHRALCAEYVLGNIHYLSSASIGITIFHGDDAYPDQVLKDADAAMYEAKKTCTA